MPVEVKDIHRELAANQPLTEGEFVDAFVKMQRDAEPVLVKALAPPGTAPLDAQAMAFEWSAANDLLPALVSEILRRNPSLQFREAAEKAGVTFGSSDFQTIADPNNPWVDAIYGEKLARAADEICTVLVNGSEKGTGFLVAPNVVATAYHVIEPLLERVDGNLRESEGSHEQLAFWFDNVIFEVKGNRKPPEVRRIQPERKWLLWVAEYHPDEGLGRLPKEEAKLQGLLDFALIRLATIVAHGRNGLAIGKDVKLGASRTDITILHHPGGKPMKSGRAQADQVVGTAYRVWHRVNTIGGSSGAPCFNDELKVVGMHQAGEANGPHWKEGGHESGAVTNGKPPNRCVPIFWSLDTLGKIAVADPGLMPLTHLPSGHPVLGRSDVNQWVFKNITGAKIPPILAVVDTSPEGDPGLPGKTFTGELLEALLPVEKHRVVRLETPSFEGLTTEAAVRTLWDKLALDPATFPTFERMSTATAHLKNVVIEALVTALGDPQVADPERKRRTWIVLDDYDAGLLDPREGGTRDFFNLLFLRADAASRLHFALLGYRDEHETREAKSRMLIEGLKRPSRLELEAFMRMDGLTEKNPKMLERFFAALNEIAQGIAFDHDYYRNLIDKLKL